MFISSLHRRVLVFASVQTVRHLINSFTHPSSLSLELPPDIVQMLHLQALHSFLIPFLSHDLNRVRDVERPRCCDA